MSKSPRSGIVVSFTGETTMSATEIYDEAIVGAVKIAKAVLIARGQDMTGTAIADEIVTCFCPEYEKAMLAAQAEIERERPERGDRERAAFILAADPELCTRFAEAIQAARETLVPGGLVASQKIIRDGEMQGVMAFESAYNVAEAIASARGLQGPEAIEEILLTDSRFPELKHGRAEIEAHIEGKRKNLGEEELIEEMAFGDARKYGSALEAADEVMEIVSDARAYEIVKEVAEHVIDREMTAKTSKSVGRSR